MSLIDLLVGRVQRGIRGVFFLLTSNIISWFYAESLGGTLLGLLAFVAIHSFSVVFSFFSVFFFFFFFFCGVCDKMGEQSGSDGKDDAEGLE
jgi:hypothetical protein